MHFDFLPKVSHNEDAVREFEQEENRRIRRWLKRIMLLLPLLAFVAWLFLHFR